MYIYRILTIFIINFVKLYTKYGIMYANTMSQAAAKQTFGECARTMMKHSEIMVKNCGHNEKGELSYVYNSRVGKSGYAV